jgi:methionyl-tRNA synthetase
LIGKDILTTHTVYWPIMLKAMGVEMPESVFAHGWWLVGDSKMSKSVGNVINPMEFADKFGVDPFRYFLMAEMVLGQDASFTEEAFVRRYNADLANDLGNLLSRLLKMIGTYTDGLLPAPGAEGADEVQLRAMACEAAGTMENAIDTMRLDLGLAAVANVVREANRYLERKQPWTQAKQSDQGPLHTTLFFGAETLRIVSGLLYPVMPGKMTELRQALGLGSEAPEMSTLKQWGVLKPGTRVGAVHSLFPRIMPVEKGEGPTSTPSKEGSKIAQAVPVAAPVGVVLAEYADFQKIQFRTARILEAERVEGADKLLKLQIDVGGERRQIVAGIALHYDPAVLPGKTVVVVANLKPAKIRGVESNGMLLAASIGKELKLITVDGEMPSGAVVK